MIYATTPTTNAKLQMQPVQRNFSPQVTHYQEVNFPNLIESAKEWELRAICRYAEKLPPPILADQKLCQLYEAIWMKKRVDLLLEICRTIDLPDYFFLDWPQDIQLKVAYAYANDPDVFAIVLAECVKKPAYVQTIIRICFEQRAVELAAKVFPHIPCELFFEHVQTLTDAIANFTLDDWRQLGMKLTKQNGFV